MSEKVLVVEDDPDIADVIEYVLGQNGYGVEVAHDGDEALELFFRQSPDIVVLDLNLPGIHGIALLQQFRSESPDVPVIIVTSRTEESDRIAGLDMGADDYVTKPFSPKELASRVRAVLRRSAQSRVEDPQLLVYGKLQLNTRDLWVRYDGKEIAVSRQELALLAALMRHPARIYTRDVLVELIYDMNCFVTDRTIDAMVKRIRKKIGAVVSGYDPIKTVYGMGYKLRAK